MKKKNYVYFIVPLVLTALFAVVYSRYHKVYEEREIRAAEKVKADRQAKREKEAKDREKAIQEAIAQAEKRKAEKAAKDAKEAADRDARERAAAERAKARDDSIRYADQVESLKKQIEETKESIARIQQDHKELRSEEAFLKDYVQKAEANTQQLTSVIERIDAAEKARAAAAAAAAKKS